MVGSSYHLQLSSVGGIGPNNWSTSGSLPGGLSVDSAGLLSGTPTGSGTFTFTAEVTDSLTTTATKDLTVYDQSGTHDRNNFGAQRNREHRLLPGAGYQRRCRPDSWAVTAYELPAGLSLEQHTGEIVGTPTSVGAFDFTVTATDSLSATASQPLSIAVGAAPTPSDQAQTAVNDCITEPASLPKRGSRQLLKAGCVTNADQRVGVTANRSPAEETSSTTSCTAKSGVKRRSQS